MWTAQVMTTVVRWGTDVLPSYLLIITDTSAKVISGSHAALTGGWLKVLQLTHAAFTFSYKHILPRTSEVRNDGVLLWYGYHSENFIYCNYGCHKIASRICNVPNTLWKLKKKKKNYINNWQGEWKPEIFFGVCFSWRKLWLRYSAPFFSVTFLIKETMLWGCSGQIWVLYAFQKQKSIRCNSSFKPNNCNLKFCNLTYCSFGVNKF